MSIIVVVRKHAQAAIAADTLQCDDDLTLSAGYVRNHEKIVRCGDTLIGLAGWAAAQTIVHSLVRNHAEELRFTDAAEVFETARRMHAIMKSEYHIATSEEKDQPVESSQLSMLIANPHGLFEVDSYRTVTEYNRFWALGSGRALAIGAIYALYERLDSAVEIATAAVEAACEFDDGCAVPVTVHSVELP